MSELLTYWFGALSSESKTAYSLLGVGIALLGYGWTIYRTWLGRSAPNPMSWVGFGLLTGVGALVQHETGAGVGAWTMDVTALACFLQGGASLLWKPGGWHWSDFERKDYAAVAAGAICTLVYLFSAKLSLAPTASAVLATVADLLLYYPAIRTSWRFPRSENAFGYAMQSAKNAPAIVALDTYAPATWLYPMMLLVMNAAMIAYFMARRVFVSVEQEGLNKARAA